MVINRYFSFSCEANDSEDSFDRFRSLIKSLNSCWSNCFGSVDDGLYSVSWLVSLLLQLAKSHSESFSISSSNYLKIEWNSNSSWVWNRSYGIVWRRILDWFFVFLAETLHTSHFVFCPKPLEFQNLRISRSSNFISLLTQVLFTVFADEPIVYADHQAEYENSQDTRFFKTRLSHVPHLLPCTFHNYSKSYQDVCPWWCTDMII